MDYTLSRKDDVVLYKLSFPGLYPVAKLSGAMSGGKVSASTADTVKWQASFNYVGDDLASGDVVRIAAVLDNGYEREERTIGTFKAFYGKRKGRSKSFSCYALTKVADSARYHQPYSAAAGDDAFDHVAAVLASCGLRLACRPGESHAIRSAKTYLPEEYTKLDIINDLLDGAGFLAADTDAYGNVVVRRSSLTPAVASIVFEEGKASIVKPDAETECDWADVANVVIVYCSTSDEEVLRAVAVNDDPADPFSTAARGENVRVESMSDAESQSVVDAKAAQLLAEERSRLDAVTIEHAYRPLALFDPVRLRIDGEDGVYSVQSIDMSLDRGLMCTTRARRFLT